MIHLFFISLVLSDLVFSAFDKLPIVLVGLAGLYTWAFKRKFKLHAFELMYLIFLMAMVATTIKVGFTGNTIQYLFLFALQFGVLSYIIERQQKNDRYIEECFDSIVKWNVIISIVGMLDFLLYNVGIISPIRDYFYSFKVDSFYPSPNIYGVMSAFSLVFTIRKIEMYGLTYTRLAVAIIFLISILLSTSSMAFGIPLVYLVVKRLNYLLMTLGVMVVIFTISYWELYAGYPNIPIDVILNKRLEIWINAFQMWSESPYLGIGTGNFQIFNDLQLYGRDIGNNYGLHSLFMWLIIETGIIGTAIFIFFIIAVLIRVNRYAVRKSVLAFLSLIFVCQLTEFYLDHEEIFSLLFWLIIAGACIRTPYFYTINKNNIKTINNPPKETLKTVKT